MEGERGGRERERKEEERERLIERAGMISKGLRTGKAY